MVENFVNIVVQINGKKRGLIKSKIDIEEKQLIDLITKEKYLSKYLENKEIKKKIFIQNKLINIIV